MATNNTKGKNTNSKKSNTDKKTKKIEVEAVVIDTQRQEIIRDIIIISVLAICILLFIGNLGFGGVVGGALSGFFFGIFGVIFYIYPVLIVILTFFIMSNLSNQKMLIKVISAIVLLLQLSILIELFTNGSDTLGGIAAFYEGRNNKSGGGFIGGFVANLFVEGFGIIGAYVIVLVISIVALIFLLQKSLFSAHKRRRGSQRTSPEKLAEERDNRKQRISRDKERQAAALDADVPRVKRKISGVTFETEVLPTDSLSELKSDSSAEMKMAFEDEMKVDKINRVTLTSGLDSESNVSVDSAIATNSQTKSSAKPNRKVSVADSKVAPATTNTSQTQSTTEKTSAAENQAKQTHKYIFPPASLLKKKPKSANPNSKASLEATADKLETTLKNFGINVEVTDVTCGPTVTRYELLPEVGVRVNRITNLADDIKLSLAVTDIRIEAPIPGKSAVGIEVPNSEKVMVSFEELVTSKEFASADSKVSFCVGRDIAGNVITSNIAKMPHLLIAGTTGSGKSVCINTIIMSILYKASPEDVRFIMIDPKVVELSIYNGIPHLLVPVVTDPKKAAGALHWAVTEMDDRYQRFANASVRDIKSYNKKLIENNYQMPINSNGEVGTFEKMPEMVVIVDELADLMMVAAKEVEESICRLAQKARAAGIYLILATQRPSVDVVTGLIKANMPSRIAFAVKSGVDSRTILDMSGAEQLLGNGDMLYYPQGYTKPLRIQGAFVSDEEVADVVDFIREHNGQSTYSEEATKIIENGIPDANMTATGSGSGFEDERDVLFADAGRMIISKEKGSIGMLQRYFKVGFNRAARIMDQLEEAGVVGPDVGTKPRQVLMNAEQFELFLDPNSSSGEDEYPVSDDF